MLTKSKFPDLFSLPTDSGSLLPLLVLIDFFYILFFIFYFLFFIFFIFIILFHSYFFFSLFLDCNLASVLVDKCKVMVSAAAPLWLTFASEEVQHIHSHTHSNTHTFTHTHIHTHTHSHTHTHTYTHIHTHTHTHFKNASLISLSSFFISLHS